MVFRDEDVFPCLKAAPLISLLPSRPKVSMPVLRILGSGAEKLYIRRNKKSLPPESGRFKFVWGIGVRTAFS